MWRYRKLAGWALLAGGFGGRGRSGPAGSVVHGWPSTHRGGAIKATPPALTPGGSGAKSLALSGWRLETLLWEDRDGTAPSVSSILPVFGGYAASLRSLRIRPLESLPSLSFQLRTPLCSETTPAQHSLALALALVLFPWRTSAPTLPPFLDVLAPPNPIKCPITHRRSSWNLQRKSQATPRIGKYRFLISLDPAAPLPSLSRMSSQPSFPDVLQFRRLWSLCVSIPGKVRGSLAFRALSARPPSESDAVSLCPGAAGLQRLNFIGWQSRSPWERKINMAGAPVWPKPSGRFSRTRRKTRSNESELANAAQVALDRQGKYL